MQNQIASIPIQLQPKTISDVESLIQAALDEIRRFPQSPTVAAALKYIAPIGYRPVVKLQEDGRKKRSTAAADKSWTPESGELLVYFEHDTGSESASTTHIKLNRAAKLGQVMQPRFNPVPVVGEPLSQTILRDRGRF